MEIRYNENPLKTHVYLNDYEKEILKLKIRIAEYEESLYSLYFDLVRDGEPNVEDATKEIRYVFSDCEDDLLSTRIEHLFKIYHQSLTDEHVGDCTAVAGSCTKCWAEEMIGANTIPGLSKHMGATIRHMFSKYNTIEEVIENNTNESVKEWLRVYRKEKLCRDG